MNFFTPPPVETASTPSYQSAGGEVQRVAQAITAEVHKAVVGQDETIENALAGLFADGHILLEGVPGTAKTLLVRALAASVSGEFKRIQFTPDLMPSDITGTRIFDQQAMEFVFKPGPLFTGLLLADEINRTPPKTQAALLEAMQEHRVTVDGETHDLPDVFMVFATQNPIEFEGTYPLPEAQLDRFLLQIDVTYPALEAERAMLLATTGADVVRPSPVLTADELLAAQRLIRQVPVGNTVIDAILRLVREGRPETSTLPMVRQHVAWGPGPRAAQALMLGVRARAVLDGRLAPSLDDVAALAGPVLRHRMALSFAARADGVALPDVIGALVTGMTV